MPTPKTAHPTEHANVPVRVENTTDATRGEPIARRARTRKAELEEAHDLLPSTELRARGHRGGARGAVRLEPVEPTEEAARADIEVALAEVAQWLAGDVEHLSHVTAAGLNRWLEHTQHLAEVAPKARRTRGEPSCAGSGWLQSAS